MNNLNSELSVDPNSEPRAEFKRSPQWTIVGCSMGACTKRKKHKMQWHVRCSVSCARRQSIKSAAPCLVLPQPYQTRRLGWCAASVETCWLLQYCG